MYTTNIIEIRKQQISEGDGRQESFSNGRGFAKVSLYGGYGA